MGRKKKKPDTKPVPLVIEYLAHEGSTRPRMRVRRSDWVPDAFEVISPEKFEAVKEFCAMFGLPMRDLDEPPIVPKGWDKV